MIMFDTFKADLRRNLQDYGPCGSLKKIALALTLNSTHAVFLIRLQQWCAGKGLPTFFAAKLLFWFFKIEISRHAKIKKGLKLPHPMGIIIAPNTEVGENCDIYADVRLVWAHGIKRGPKIGNNVFLGDGAKLVGDIHIGQHAIIGVSSVVTKDVPADCTAVGNPARIIDQSNGRATEFPKDNPDIAASPVDSPA
jgi:serine O-acetyltransferase